MTDPVRVSLYRLTTRTQEPIPPFSLRAVVGTGRTVDRFISGGWNSFDAIRRSLEHAGYSLADFHSILDFGCGSGRTLRHIRREHPTGLHGCDVNPAAVRWMRSNYADIPVVLNQFSPPLPYRDASFDLVYSISVFTHLDESDQQNWLREVERVLEPSGLALLTVHGEHAYELFRSGVEHLTRSELASLRSRRSLAEEGLVYEEYEVAETDSLFSRARTYGLTFQSEAYTTASWTDGLEVLAVLPRLVEDRQDMVILRKRR